MFNKHRSKLSINESLDSVRLTLEYEGEEFGFFENEHNDIERNAREVMRQFCYSTLGAFWEPYTEFVQEEFRCDFCWNEFHTKQEALDCCDDRDYQEFNGNVWEVKS
jgi:hypothetical protein